MMSDFTNIPAELRERAQWVTWRLVISDGKERKIPYTIDGRAASSTDPATWATYEQVTAASDKIAYMFGADDPYTGIDFDAIDDEVLMWMRRLDSYSEESQSGRGLHVIVKATKPGDKCKHVNRHVEIYDHARPFVMTGKVIAGQPLTINERQSALDELYFDLWPKVTVAPSNSVSTGGVADDHDLLQRMFASANGGKIDALWRGDISGHGNDHSSADLALCNALAFWTGNDPARMDRLFRQSALYRDKWDRNDYRTWTIDRAIADTQETYRGKPMQQQASKIHTNGNGEPPAMAAEAAKIDDGKHDYGNAVAAQRLHGDKLLFVPEQGWMRWTGTHWATDGAEAAANAAIVSTLKQRAKTALDSNDLDLLRATTPSNKRIRDAKEQFRYLVMTNISEFDHEPHLLNTASGVVDLRSGDLVTHERSNRFSYCVNTEYDPGAPADLWMDLQLQWFGIDRAEYVQRAMGYSITGDSREECLFYEWGPKGRNGKGTLTNTVADIIGYPLAKGISFSVFQNDRSDPQGFQIAPLHNARMVVASEGNSSRLNESVLKTISGRDKLQVSFKGRTAFQFQPRFKIWLMSNHAIKGDPDDDAFWRRCRLIEFAHSYIGREDRTLKDTLQQVDNRKGILAWLILGAKRWYDMGLGDPAWMATALEQQRSDNDGVGRFLGDHTVDDPATETSLDMLYTEYKNWCDDEGIKPQAKNWLMRRLKTKGYDTRRDLSVRPTINFIKGLRIT